MTSLAPFAAEDLFRFNAVNLDPLTETYNISFYLQYLALWPEYFTKVLAPGGGSHACAHGASAAPESIVGYIMGKAEGTDKLWHGHVTAVTVAASHRRLGIATTLMRELERVSEAHRCFFVDLFVRVSNATAVAMYERMGYAVYRRVLKYYAASAANDEGEDAYDMRKSLSRDPDKLSMVPLPKPITPDELEWW